MGNFKEISDYKNVYFYIVLYLCMKVQIYKDFIVKTDKTQDYFWK